MLEKVFENKTIRTVIKDDGVWFVGKDVAVALGYVDTVNALKKHVWKEDKIQVPLEDATYVGGKTPPTTYSGRTVTLINESGMYALIFGSKLESAQKFKHWVTTEVLPSIRKNGFYVNNNLTPNQVARLQQTASNYNALLKDKEYLEKQVEMLDRKNDKLIELIVQTSFKNRR